MFYLDFGDDPESGEATPDGPSSTLGTHVEETLLEVQSEAIGDVALLLPAHVFVSEAAQDDVVAEEGTIQPTSSGLIMPLDSGIHFVDDDSKPVCPTVVVVRYAKIDGAISHRLANATLKRNINLQGGYAPFVESRDISPGCARSSL